MQHLHKNILAKTTVREYPTSMNQTERKYALYLTTLQRSGQILRWDFEAEKLRLAEKTFYSPDFRVIMPDGTIQFHEVKGFWRDDARVKIKVAAYSHPYKFIAVSATKKGGWSYEEF